MNAALEINGPSTLARIRLSPTARIRAAPFGTRWKETTVERRAPIHERALALHLREEGSKLLDGPRAVCGAGVLVAQRDDAIVNEQALEPFPPRRTAPGLEATGGANLAISGHGGS